MIRNSLLIFLLSFVCCGAYARVITGRYVDADTLGLPGVNVALLSTDSLLVTGTTTDNNGCFIIKDIVGGNYILSAKMIGYDDNVHNVVVQNDLNLGTLIFSEKKQQLEEVLVMSDIRRTFANRDELLLPQDAKKNSQNAVDAISQIPKFSKDINDRLATIDGKTLLIVIDGKVATNEDLLALPPADIRRLTHYTIPPARYSRYGAGSIIEVQTHKRKKRQYDLSLNAMNGINTRLGNNSLTFSYADSLNSFAAQYHILYTDYDDVTLANTYRYMTGGKWQENSYLSDGTAMRDINQQAKLTYQRTGAKYMFCAEAKYINTRASCLSWQDVSITAADGNVLSGSGHSALENMEEQFALDLYFSLALPKGQELLFNVVNTYSRSSADNAISRHMYTDLPYYNYSIGNIFNNNVYSLIAQLTYSIPLWGGHLEALGLFEHKQLKQLYNHTSGNSMNYQQECIMVSYLRQWGKVDMSANLCLKNMTFNGSVYYNFFNALPFVVVNYNLSGQFSSRLHVGAFTNSPGIGNLVDSRVSIDERYVSVGNPGIRPFYGFQSIWSMTVSNKTQTLFFMPSVEYRYRNGSIMSMLYSQDGLYYKQIRNSPYNHCVGLSAQIQWSPVKQFTVMAGGIFYFDDYRTVNNKINQWWGNQGIGIRLNFGEIRAEAMLYQPLADLMPMTVDGDYSTWTTMGYSVNVAWTHDNFNLRLRYLRNPQNRIRAFIPDMTVFESTDIADERNIVNISFSYRFRYGDARRRDIQKRLNNEDTDTGLTDDMRAR